MQAKQPLNGFALSSGAWGLRGAKWPSPGTSQEFHMLEVLDAASSERNEQMLSSLRGFDLIRTVFTTWLPMAQQSRFKVVSPGSHQISVTYYLFYAIESTTPSGDLVTEAQKT
jgi:hypothetical protein